MQYEECSTEELRRYATLSLLKKYNKSVKVAIKIRESVDKMSREQLLEAVYAGV
jgi:hypothetical protein